MIGDRHIHSHFSFDGSEKTQDILYRAIALGMKEICITDHNDTDMGPDWFLSVNEYTRELERLKNEYADRIELHIGIELGLNPEFNDSNEELLSSYPFEYVIGSVHTMLGKDLYFRNKYDMDDRTYYKIYFETLLERVRSFKNFDVLGHFDYVVRYGKEAEKYDPSEFADTIDEILKEIIGRNIALEINTGGIRKGALFVHPHEYILKRYKKLGGHLISIGSDAHKTSDIGADFDKALEMMKAYGFTEEDIVKYRA